MSLSARIIEPWLLVVNDVNLRTVKHVENDTAAKKIKGWLEQADHCTVVQRRHFVGLHSFRDESGNSCDTFRWFVGGTTWLTFTKVSSKKNATKYLCTHDKIEIEDHIAGSGWQEQTWELQSAFEEVSGSYYENAVTAPED